MTTSTIFARASGPGRTGIAVYRISGPRTYEVLEKLVGKRCRPRYAERVSVWAGEGDLLDDGIALYFPCPNSFTGEDVAELQLHGSPAVEQRLSALLVAWGLEPAGPGAFTMRAFANGKLDLTQAEGLADLIEAETALQHRQAVQQLRGALREEAEGWRTDLIAAMAAYDAAVDFPDEEDVPEDVARRAAVSVASVRAALEEAVAQAGQSRRVTEGIQVVIIGPPNAGKSTIFNRLVNAERAIVSDEAGTTRDVVSTRIDMAGHLVTLNDTAGLHEETDSAVEREGMARAKAVAEAADLRLLAFPAGAGAMPEWLTAWRRPTDLVIRTKSDLALETSGEGLRVSQADAETIDELRGALKERFDGLAQPGLVVSSRQEALLRAALGELDYFATGSEALIPEVAAEALRSAARRLEELTGRIAPDDILDDIFSSFCIGK